VERWAGEERVEQKFDVYKLLWTDIWKLSKERLGEFGNRKVDRDRWCIASKGSVLKRVRF